MSDYCMLFSQTFYGLLFSYLTITDVIPFVHHKFPVSFLLYIATKTLKQIITVNSSTNAGSRVGAVVRALAFHQRVPGSIPGPGVICGLSLLVLYFAPRGFSPGTPVFPSPQKPTFDLIYLISFISFI